MSRVPTSIPKLVFGSLKKYREHKKMIWLGMMRFITYYHVKFYLLSLTRQQRVRPLRTRGGLRVDTNVDFQGFYDLALWSTRPNNLQNSSDLCDFQNLFNFWWFSTLTLYLAGVSKKPCLARGSSKQVWDMFSTLMGLGWLVDQT